jgi:hypothetical protein
MNLELDNLKKFFLAANHCDTISSNPISVEDLAKKMGVELPASLKGYKVRLFDPNPKLFGKQDKKGKLVATFYEGSSYLTYLSFLAKSRCFVYCADEDIPIVGGKCITVCVTCLDGWPGPGCWIRIYD